MSGLALRSFMKLKSLLLCLLLGLVLVYAQVPCDCGERPTSCFANPCAVSPPKQACKLQCYSKYCDGCQAVCACNSDLDCYSGEFCRPTSKTGISVCTPLSFTGESCGGFIGPPCRHQCAPGFECLGPLIPDLPGKCYRFCEKGACCGTNVFCSPTSNLCLPLGSCSSDADCLPTVQTLPSLPSASATSPFFRVCRYQCGRSTNPNFSRQCIRVCTLPGIGAL